MTNSAAPAPANGVFVVGSTFGSLVGSSAGALDAWLARYDAAGAQVWIRQLGTSGYDSALASAADGAGGCYVAGFTDASLGGTNAGGSDAWFARYDGAGGQSWVRQLGTSSADTAWSVANDGAGGMFVSGDSSGSLAAPNAGANDVWLARYDGVGNQLWKRQFGTVDSDAAFGSAPDANGGVFVCGSTYGAMGAPHAGGGDAWLAHYDALGNQLWVRQLGTSGSEYARAAAEDGSGGVFVCGFTDGSLGGPSAGNSDAWLARYDGAGNRLWLRQLGTSMGDGAESAASDGQGRVLIGGYTDGDLGGTNAGGADAWLASFDGAGSQLWMRQLGSLSLDDARAVASDGSNGAYVGGLTRGDLGGPNAGVDDGWVARYSGSILTTYCTSGSTTHGCTPAIGASGVPSASTASGFVIGVTSVEGLKQGLIFYGVDNSGFAALPWGASPGFLCVKPPLQRTTPQSSGGTSNACDGALAIDWNAFRAAHPSALGAPFSPGLRVFAQGWFRDPPSSKWTMLSDALEFVVQL